MAEPLILVGASGFAREAAEVVHALNSVESQWDLLGFVDDDEAVHGKSFEGTPVIGPIDAVHDHSSARVAVCTGRPSNYFSRPHLVSRLDLEDDRFATLIHPSASFGRSVTVGAGTVVLASAVATANVSIGKHVSIMSHVGLTHDDVVEDFVTMTSHVVIAGGTRIQHGAFLGTGAMINAGLKVGKWSLVGMGSVLLRDVPDEEVWVGNPAKKLRDVTVPDNVK